MTFLKAVKMVNGFDMVQAENYNEDDIICNGFGDVVAQFIQKHKEEVEPVHGDGWKKPFQLFDIYPAVSGQEQEYTYYVTYDVENSSFTVKVDSYHEDEQHEEMSLEQFEQLCNTKYLEHILSFLNSQLQRLNQEEQRLNQEE